MDRLVESGQVGEGLVGEMTGFEIAPDDSISLSSGVYLGSHSTTSQCARSASAASVALLTWIGPLSSTRTTGLAGARALVRRDGREAADAQEIAAALGRAGGDDELAGDVIERPHHRHLLGLSGAGTRQTALRLAQARAR